MHFVHNILLAEDNPADVYLIQEALRAHGVQFDLHVTPDGKEALTLLTGLPLAERGIGSFALIILDLNLPRHDGMEILQRLKESASKVRPPVVVLTSSDSPRDKKVAIELGACCYLRKPSNLDEFLALGSVFKNLLESPPAQGVPCEDNGRSDGNA